MKKSPAIFVTLLLLPAVAAHADHGGEEINSTSDTSDSLEPGSAEASKTGFQQLYPEYRSGTAWVIAEVAVVLGATLLAFRHYFRKSESSSLKEFIREEVV